MNLRYSTTTSPFFYKTALFLLIMSCFSGGISSLTAQTNGKIPSPNGRLVFNWAVSPVEGELLYSITMDGTPIILESGLGITQKDRRGWEKGLEVSEVEKIGVDTFWTPVYGERDRIPEHYQQVVLHLKRREEPEARLQLVVRAYDTGIAFRYHFPESGATSILDITSEQTEFHLPEGSKAWYTPRPQGSYELVPIADWDQAAEMPLTIELADGRFASIMEAEVVDYAVSNILPVPGASNTLQLTMKSMVTLSSPCSTPWRLIRVSETAGDLLEGNHLILSLNPPSAIDNPWWIKPGKVIREITLSTGNAVKCVDFAVAHNLQYIHFDAGWYGYEYTAASDATTVTVDPRRNPKQDLDLHEAIRYAKSKGIGVLVYVNRRALEQQLDEILPLYKKWGIDGIKYGFVQTGSHRWNVWLHEAIRKAAEHQLMVDVHDRYRPTGFSRTYPNLMTMEGIRGNEEMPDATHNTVLPFTRFVSGKADYTVCYYYRKEFGHPNRHIQTTPAHQLALSVVYYSPWQWLFWYDRPDDYQGEPEIEFFEKVSTSWDDTRVLAGRIGQFAAVARRKGQNWFVGAITNNDARQLTVNFDFLEPNTTYLASVFTDGGPEIPTRTKVKIERYLLTAKHNRDFSLKASGGVAIILEPATAEDLENYRHP